MSLVKRLVSLSIASGLAAFTVIASRATSQQAVLAQDIAIPQKRQIIAQRQSRIALVIGNADYDEDRLANPVNDATDIAAAFEELGFEVILLQNQNRQEMEDAIEAFSRKLHKGSVGVFYYAGHGVQVDKENYLIPIKARLLSETTVPYEAVPLGRVLNSMKATGNLWNVVILDACRDTPWYRKWYRSSGNSRGLTKVPTPAGIFIAYATDEGSVAADGRGQRNSPYTSSLLEKIKKPDLDVRLMFGEVAKLVLQKTDQKQVPSTTNNLIGGDGFYLNPTNDTSKILIPPISPAPVKIPIPPRLPVTVAQPRRIPDINLESFRRFNIDIFYFEGRKDLESVALSVKNELDKYPLNLVQVREFNRQQGYDLVICPWFEVRYDFDELDEAKSIKYLLEKSFSNLTLTLTETNKGENMLPTRNYLSIFITDSNTLSKVYPESNVFEYMNGYCNRLRQQ
jgi:hypothetical protein